MSILFRLPLRPFLPKAALPAERRVLLVCDDVIGDLIVPISAAITWLKEQNHDPYLVMRKELIEIGKILLPAEKLIPVDIKLYRASIKYRFNFLKNIRKSAFSIAIGSIIHSSVNDDIVRSSGAEARWGYKRNNKFKENFRLRGIRKVRSLENINAAEREYLSVVDHERYFLESVFHTKIAAQTFFPSVQVAPGDVAGAPTGYIHYLAEAGAVKRVFPPERLLPLLLAIARKADLKIVLTGLNKIECDDDFCVNLTGRTTLPEVVNIVAGAEFVIGNESGLAHLAWVLGKKTAMFYGGGHWGRFKPAPEVLLLNADCAYRCCDWKCRYDSIPVPCVNLDDSAVQSKLENFILGK